MTTIDTSKSYLGTCQICFNQQVAKGRRQPVLVLHGYERPGHGWINGRCNGVRELPYELSCEATKRWRGRCQERLDLTQDRLGQLERDEVEEFVVQVIQYDQPRVWNGRQRRYPTKFVTIKRGESHTGPYGRQTWTFDGERQRRIFETKSEISGISETIRYLDQRIAEWSYRPEALQDHATLVAAEQTKKAEEKAERDTWRAYYRKQHDLWQRVADAVRDHKNGYTFHYQDYRKRGLFDAERFVAENPFPSDKERAAARKRVR